MAAPRANDESFTFLFVVGSPDDRLASQRLLGSLNAIKNWSIVRGVPIHIHVWFLRAKPEDEPWPHSFVVDSLRSWLPARALELVGLGRVAAGLRGRVLAARWRRVAPDAVIFDDGVGDRIMPTWADPMVIDRINEDQDEFVSWEPPQQRARALVWATSGADLMSVGDVPVIWEPDHSRRFDAARKMRSEAARNEVRQRLGIESARPLVVGWGRDGWADAPELMMRALWSLEHRFGVAADALWLGPGIDQRMRERLLADADRAGLAGRLTFTSVDGLAERCCGDAVFLPHRAADDGVDLVPIAFSGCKSVAFWPEYVDAHIRDDVMVVDPLDLDAAASALALSLASSRAETIDRTDSIDFDGWFDVVLSHLADR